MHLHCFHAIRRMDEILLANFMVFHDLVRDEQYDLWIGDEAWESTTTCTKTPSRSGRRTRGSLIGWLPMRTVASTRRS